jgi:hypothetical protein
MTETGTKTAAKTTVKAAEKPAEKRRGRKKLDPDFPFGKNPDGSPQAPYGFLDNGKPRQVQRKHVDASKLNLDVLDKVQTPTQELSAVVAPTRERERSAEQLRVDAYVRAAHSDWIKVGRPTNWAKIPQSAMRVLPVPPEHVTEYKTLVNRAAAFEGVTIRWGAKVPTDKASGRKLLIFVVVDRRSYKKSGENGK